MGKRPDRRAKLAQALRENLRRRKEQERRRGEASEEILAEADLAQRAAAEEGETP